MNLIKVLYKSSLEDVIIKEYRNIEKKAKVYTLETVYAEWLRYFELHTTKTSSVKRCTSEWERYYASDPLVKHSLRKLTKLILDEWVHEKIKSYNMTKKQYYRMSYIIRHCMEYAKENGYIQDNVFSEVKVDARMFRRERKKEDETQVYLESEQPLIIAEAWKDYYSKPKDTTPLALILLFYTIGNSFGISYSIKGTSCQDAQLEERKLLLRSPLARRESRKRDSFSSRSTSRRNCRN